MSVADNRLRTDNGTVNNQCCTSFQGTTIHRNNERDWYIDKIKCYIKQNQHAQPDQIWEWFKSSGCTIWEFSTFKKNVYKWRQIVWLETNSSLQTQNPNTAANILKQNSTRPRGQPQKEKLPQKNKHIEASNSAALNLFGEYDFKDVDINNVHSKGFNYIRKALNYLSTSKHAPTFLQKFPLGDSLLLHIELHKSIGNDKSYENRILASSVLSIDDSTTKKPRKKPKPYELKRKKSIEDNADNIYTYNVESGGANTE
eukprot:308096_1